jgi:hypothetical protein
MYTVYWTDKDSGVAYGSVVSGLENALNLVIAKKREGNTYVTLTGNTEYSVSPVSPVSTPT